MPDDPTPTHVPRREHTKVERDGKLYLPEPHPLIESPEEGSPGAVLNANWRGLNYFLRGLYGTFVEWGVSWMDLVLEYPRVALVAVLLVGIVSEETMSEHPILARTYQYALYTLDEEAAMKIWPPETTVSEGEKAIDKLAADIVTTSAEEYYNSPEYKQLELEVKAKMHLQVTEAVYRMAGLEAPTATPPTATSPATVTPQAPAPVEPVIEEGLPSGPSEER